MCIRSTFVLVFLALALPQQALAEAAQQQVSASRVRELTQAAVSGLLPQGVEVREVRWTQAVRIAAGRLTVRAVLERDEPSQGRIRARLALLVGGEEARVLRIQIQVNDQRRVVVAKRRLTAGTTIGQSDVELRPPAPGASLQTPLRSLDEVIGQVTTRVIDAGQVMTDSAVRPPAAVSRGQAVRIRVRSGGVVVVAQGEPLQNAQVGDTVRVICATSRQTVEALVTGPGQVEVTR